MGRCGSLWVVPGFSNYVYGHLHISYFFPTFVILAAFVCHYFQSTRYTKGNEFFNNFIEMKYSGDNFEAV